MSSHVPSFGRRSLVATVVSLVAIAACSLDSKVCTLATCSDGLFIDATFRDPGSYVFAITVDGATTTCRATLPVGPATGASACDGPPGAVTLTQRGSALPASEQSLGGLQLATKTATSVTVKVTKDGAVIADKTFAPAYVTKPGPNGPDCDPPTCTNATETL